jgi:prophage regulatory protein
MTESTILTSREVDDIVPLSSTTRWRQEKLGRFPRRFQISSRKIGYHRAEINAWLNDPNGWRDRQTVVVPAKAGR